MPKLPANDTKANKPLSVSAAVKATNEVLGEHVFRIEGEVSELSDKRGYKAVYFTLKDEGATLSCMMWKSRYVAAEVPLSLGAKVIVVGKFSIYAPKGRMQFEVTALRLEGEGELRAKVAALAARLQAEGLMDPAKKRPLPIYPEVIGLVTSPRGAVVHDVLRTLRRRSPNIRVLFAGVNVESKTAARDMEAALRCVVDAGAEAVLLVRGGGAYEDFMPFNDEGLARYIASCPVPVVTGIGHEPDTCIADLVADVRQSTPTYAAAAVAIDQSETNETLSLLATRMCSKLKNRLGKSHDYIEARASRPVMRDFMSLYKTDAQRLDFAQDSLERGLQELTERPAEQAEALRDRLVRAIPAAQAASANELAALAGRLAQSSQTCLVAHRHDVDLAVPRLASAGRDLMARPLQEAALVTSRLNDLSPLATLERGWSIAKDGQGSVVSSIDQVAAGDPITVQLKDGRIQAVTTETTPHRLFG